MLAVKIDNIVNARPQTGLSRADIVYVNGSDGTTFTTGSGQPMMFARGPVWVVLASS